MPFLGSGQSRADLAAERDALVVRCTRLEAERDAYRRAFEWAIWEGGWRLAYYAAHMPPLLDKSDIFNLRVRPPEELTDAMLAWEEPDDA